MVFEIIYMKADYEPWWMFEDWETTIQSRRKFDTATDAKLYLDELKKEFEAKYMYKEERENCFFAYWSETERCFCDGCDEDLQIFHGLLSLVDGKPSNMI